MTAVSALRPHWMTPHHQHFYLQVVEATLSQEVYEHEEDFFFRTVHLGTECWSFVALNRMAAAKQLAEEGQWHVAAARIIQVCYSPAETFVRHWSIC